MQRTPQTTKNYPAQNVNSAKGENPDLNSCYSECCLLPGSFGPLGELIRNLSPITGLGDQFILARWPGNSCGQSSLTSTDYTTHRQSLSVLKDHLFYRPK